MIKRWHLAVALLILLLFLFWQRHGISVAEQRAEAATDSARTAHAAVDSLRQLEEALRSRYTTDTVTLTHWRTRWDSIVGPGRTDTLTVERVVTVADSTIRACTAAVQTCEQRVAVATARGDSAQAEAAHWQEAAGQWKKVAKGPILTLAVEATLTPSDWTPQAAVDLTLGRGRLRALGRVEAEQGTQSCSFTSAQDAYTCSTAGTITARIGARWVF